MKPSSARTSRVGAVGDDLAAVEHDRARAQLERVGEVVGDEQDREPQRDEHVEQLAARRGVQRGRCGSSRISTSGLHAEHAGDRPRGGARPRSSACGGAVGESWSARRAQRLVTRSRSASPRRPRLAGPKATSASTVGMKSWSSASWKTIPTRRRTSARVRRRGRGRRRVIVPLAVLEHAVELERERRLARAVGAEHARRARRAATLQVDAGRAPALPSGIGEAQPAAARAPAAPGTSTGRGRGRGGGGARGRAARASPAASAATRARARRRAA